MNIFWFIVFFVIGYLLFSFSLIQVLLTLFCGLPLKKILRKNDVILDDRIDKSDLITIVIHIVLCCLVSIPIILFGSRYMILGFIAGLGVCFLFSLPSLGMTISNIDDYVKSHQKYLDMEQLELITTMHFNYTSKVIPPGHVKQFYEWLEWKKDNADASVYGLNNKE